MKFISAVFCLLLFISCHPPQNDPDSPEALLAFIPEGYMLKDTVRGDLNLDGRSDLILVLNKTGEEETPDSLQKRLLLLLLAHKNQPYDLAVKTENAIYCYYCGGVLGDPYQQITVKDGQFSLAHFGGSSWRWARTTTFKYIKAQDAWYLAEDALVTSHSGNPDNIETRIRTTADFGEIRLENFDIYSE